jgi:regulatory protein
MVEKKKKYVSLKEAQQKLKNYCAYQERCHSEVTSKAFDLGLNIEETNILIAGLIEENYLNEERFAIQFAGGKFRVKQWGKIKINYELKAKFINPTIIKKALATIDLEDYYSTVTKLYKAYYLKQKGLLQIKKIKTLKHLQLKGYEIDIINEVAKSSLAEL